MALTSDQIDAQIDVLLLQLSKPASVQFKDRKTDQRSVKEIMEAIVNLRAQKLQLLGNSSATFAAFRK